MPLEDFNLPLPWNHYLHQIEIASQSFWRRRYHPDSVRLQGPMIWRGLCQQLRKISDTLLPKPLTPVEVFLLYAAAYLYETGWQTIDAPQFSYSERFAESGRLIRASSVSSRRDFDLGVSALEPRTVEALAQICSAMEQTELVSLSILPVPVGYQETARLRYLVALLQLADLLFVNRTNEAILHSLPSLDPSNIADARLALQPYIPLIHLENHSVTVYFKIHPDDERLVGKMIGLFEEPLKQWLASNWEWLYTDFDFLLKLEEPHVEIIQSELSPSPLRIACPPLPSFLERFQPSALRTDMIVSERKTIAVSLDASAPSVDVGIIMASEEFDELHREIKDRSRSYYDARTGRIDYHFEHRAAGGNFSYNCAATFVGGMSQLKTSLMIQKMMSQWKPRTLVVLGFAEAVNKEVQIGDVVVADQIDGYSGSFKAILTADHQAFTFSGEVYHSSSRLLYATKNFKFAHGEALQDWQQHCQLEMGQFVTQDKREKLVANGLLGNQPKVVVGHIARSPSAQISEAFTDWLKALDRTYLAQELDAEGFVAALYEVAEPKRILLLRAISAYADGHKRELKQELGEAEEGIYRRYAMHNTIQFVWRLLDAGFFPIGRSTSSPIKARSTATISSPDDPEAHDEDRKRNNSAVQINSSTMSSPPRRINAFIGYSHRDRRFLSELHVHLAMYERMGMINFWDDTKIQPGAKWREEINKALLSAKVAILLISAEFLASDFIAVNELPPLLEAAEKEGATILSVILRPCSFMDTGLAQFQTVNAPSTPLSGMTRGRRDEVWRRVAELVRDALKT